MERKGTDNNGIGSASKAQKGDLAAKGGPGAEPEEKKGEPVNRLVNWDDQLYGGFAIGYNRSPYPSQKIRSC